MKRNYKQFWALLSLLETCLRVPVIKDDLVKSYTGDGTTHLKEMTDEEYYHMIDNMQNFVEKREQQIFLKKSRSSVLHQMQIMGMDTADWDKIDAFCLQPRIAGNKFSKLSVDELSALLIKLRIISRKDKAKELN